MALQRVSEYFGLTEEVFIKAGTFDPVIGVDSLFFVDPLRLRQTKVPEFRNSLDEIRLHYGRAIKLLRHKNDKAKKAAKILLQRREIRGIGIGYGDKSDDGSAVGSELADRLIFSANELLDMGISDPAIFEVMGLFEDNFGPDRISDSVISILQDRIYAYTERMSEEIGLPRDFQLEREEKTFVLPTHPSGGKPLLLLPKDILRSLPIASSLGDISVAASFSSEVRAKFNKLLAPCFATSVSKKEIRKHLFGKAERLGVLMAAYNSGLPKPYDFENDPEGIISWFDKAREIVEANPLSIPVKPTPRQISEIVPLIISSFQNFIENKGGWRGLYDDKRKPLNERHARLIFYATALNYQGSSDIDISPESNAGQGPVDFKLSRGSKDKIIVEIKLSKGKVEQGYAKQTEIYQKSEEAKESYFVVLKVSKKPKNKKKRQTKKSVIDRIIDMAKADDKIAIPHPKIIVVDATPRRSASAS